MVRLIICAALFSVAACATERTKLEVAGRYADQLSKADIHQITALIVVSEMYDHGKATLETIRPDKVRVSYIGYERTIAGLYTSGVGSTYFIALKRNGRWAQEGDRP